jgi:WD40 repeat protein
LTRKWIATGSFDCNLRIWNEQGQIVDSIAKSDAAIKSIQWASSDYLISGDSQGNIYGFYVITLLI